MPSSGDAMDLDGSENRAPGNLESNPDQTEPYVNIFRHISPENQGPQRGTNASPEESEQSISPSPPSQQLPGPLGYDSRDPGAIYDDDYDDTLLPPALAKDYEDTDSELANSAVGDALSDALRYFGSGLPEEHKLVESYGLTSLQIIHIRDTGHLQSLDIPNLYATIVAGTGGEIPGGLTFAFWSYINTLTEDIRASPNKKGTELSERYEMYLKEHNRFIQRRLSRKK